MAVICIEKLFLKNRNILHSGFNLYLPFWIDNRKDMQVLMAVEKNILNRVIIDNKTNLVGHPYCFVLDIKKLHSLTKKVLKKIKIVNLYNNKVDRR